LVTGQATKGETMPIEMVNANPKYGKAKLIDPSPLGYIHIGAEVAPPSRPGPVFRVGGDKRALLERLKEDARRLVQLDNVERATVFRAIALMPAGEYVKQHPEKPPAKFDVVVLVETVSTDAIPHVQASEEYQALMRDLEPKAKRLHVIAAKNIKRTGDVDKSRQGTFVFNHLIGDDPEVVLENWEWMGGWYAVETGLDNSTLLYPLEDQKSDYVAINNARWNISLPRLVLRQVPKRSFWNYVQKNLDAHHIGAWPVFYRLA
jgi:hypothetical protein